MSVGVLSTKGVLAVWQYETDHRHLAIASNKGHIATFDWQAGKLHSEIQLREAVRDIK